MHTLNVLPQSCQSVYTECRYRDQIISTATGFIVHFNSSYYFITNRHVATGRDNNTEKILSEKTGAIPDKLVLYLYAKGESGKVIPCKYELSLYNSEDMVDVTWKEHPYLGSKVDVVVFCLNISVSNDSVFLYTLNDSEEGLYLIQPSDYLSVIGYPFGEVAGGKSSSDHIAIWATGFLATDLDIDYNGLPMFLIDCRTRTGQSGSPVVFHRNSGTVKGKNGSLKISTGPITELLGCYSGRINCDSDIGMVWKKKIIKEIILGK